MYHGYYERTDLPIRAGDVVRILKGTKICSTHPEKEKRGVAGRTYNVKVHHLLPGATDNPIIDGKITPVPRDNPCVCWAGKGGYWCEVDINDVIGSHNPHIALRIVFQTLSKEKSDSLYATAREMIRMDRDAVEPRTLKQYIFGLIYDAMGWSNKNTFTDTHYWALTDAVFMATGPTIEEKTWLNVRNTLQRGGLSVMPEGLLDE